MNGLNDEKLMGGEQEGKYSVIAPAAPWAGGPVFTAAGPGGEKVLLREASKAEAGAAPFLSHPCLPAYLGAGEAGGKKFLVYEYFDGESLQAEAAAGGTFTEFEAVKIAYETARALKYLHGLSPRVAHGDVSAGSVFRAKGGRLLLCGRGPSAGPEGDMKGLAGLMRRLADSPRAGTFSADYFKIAGYLELPGADAGDALKSIEALGAGPVARPEARPQIFKRFRHGLPLLAWPLAAAVALLFFYGAFYIRFEVWPQFRAKRLVAATTVLFRKFNCSSFPRPEIKLGENLLVNPGLEGPCGWTMFPTFDGAVLKKGGANSGEYCFATENDMPLVKQEVDVSAFSGSIASGQCKAELSAYMRASGFGKDGAPFLYGYAKLNADDPASGTACEPVESKNWTRGVCEFPLPAGTKKVRVELDSTVTALSLFSRKAYYDDVSLKVRCN
ncbi:MAG: hypothetical protein Q7R35_07415 [Elusimicrobiota bacterium]|nr:hypothetical protein [Elusimicrobiota bacterium]